MQITGTFQKPLRRLISEGVAIKNKKPEENLNSKAEFHGSSVQRLKYESEDKHCEHCDYVCNTNSALKTHVNNHHNHLVYRCEHCEYVCKANSSLKTHMNSHHADLIYRCDQCINSYNSKSILKTHMKLHHDATWTNYTSDINNLEPQDGNQFLRSHWCGRVTSETWVWQ